jgi:superfamily II DNA or RNA helicase
MKIAEIYTEKKTKKEKILLHFDYNEQLKDKIKDIPGRMYVYNTKNWILPHNEISISHLKQLNFKIVNGEGINNKQLKIKSITISNNYITIFATDVTRYIISKQFTFFDYKNCFLFGKFDMKKAIKNQLFIMKSFSILIPIGFKNDLFEFFSNYKYINKWKNLIYDYRKKRKWKYTNEEIKNILEYITLYDTQIEAIKQCFQQTNGIVKLLPGLGKTEIFLALCKLMNIKTLILTNSITLTQQTYERGKKAGLDVGIVQGQNMDEDHQIIMATIQSSHKLNISSYLMVIVDECHEIDNQFNNILFSENLLYRFGFSATPFGKDKLKNAIVKQYIGNIIYTVDSKVLQKEGKIAIPHILITDINQPDNMYEHKVWRHVEKIGIINNNYRNKIIIDIVKKCKKQTLILVKKIEHGEILQKMLSENNIKSKFLYGSVSKKKREEILKEFDENKNEFVLIGCKVLKQGISLNHIYNLIMAGAGSSYYETIQMIGRGLRVKEKDKVFIYDFQDSFNKLAYNQSKRRVNDYKAEGFDQIIFN